MSHKMRRPYAALAIAYTVGKVGGLLSSPFQHQCSRRRSTDAGVQPLFQRKFRSWEDDSKPSHFSNDARERRDRDRGSGGRGDGRRREYDRRDNREDSRPSNSMEGRDRRVPAPLLPPSTMYESENDATDMLEHFYSKKGFEEIGASSLAIQAMEATGVTRPSKIQAAAYQQVLEGHHCVIAEQTGSGKTLAYLVPLLQRLRQEEEKTTDPGVDAKSGQEKKRERNKARPGRPRVLILSPTSELAQQVQSVARRLTGVMPARVACFTGGNTRSMKSQASLLKEGVDVLIATPGRIITLLQDGILDLEDCRAVVLDEVDVLFLDETFRLAPIGSQAPDGSQFLFVTATLPQEVSDMVKAEFPDTRFITGPGLHRVAPGVQEVLVDCSGPPDEIKNEETGLARKREALMSQLDRRASALRTLIFCNTIKSCREVENMLRRSDRQSSRYATLAYHSAIEPTAAAANLKEFGRSNALRPMILICTDRSSRGMDFEQAPVDHVVLFDFPRDPIEYMRRVGRTARAGRTGVVTVLAWGRQVPLAREIMKGNKAGRRLLSLDD